MFGYYKQKTKKKIVIYIANNQKNFDKTIIKTLFFGLHRKKSVKSTKNFKVVKRGCFLKKYVV